MLLKHRSIAALMILAALSAAALTASCDGGKKSAASSAGTRSDQATPPATRYGDYIQAGGIAPPSGELRNPHPGDADSAKAGENLFASMNCDGCHGGGGSGWVGPSLADGRWRYGGADNEIFNSVFYGRPKGMPAYGGAIGTEGVWMLVTYLKSLPLPDAVPTQSWIEPEGSVARPAQNEETSGAAASVRPPPAAPATAAADLDLPALLRKSGCTACHAVDRKVIGPSYQDVAAKYRKQAGAEQRLFDSARNGSSGVWGDIPMPPNAAVSDDELHSIVKKILTLK